MVDLLEVALLDLQEIEVQMGDGDNQMDDGEDQDIQVDNGEDLIGEEIQEVKEDNGKDGAMVAL